MAVDFNAVACGPPGVVIFVGAGVGVDQQLRSRAGGGRLSIDDAGGGIIEPRVAAQESDGGGQIVKRGGAAKLRCQYHPLF